MIIAIDGPAGSGKTTVAKAVARRLAILYLDTGAMYRALTLNALNENIPLTDEKTLTKLAQELAVTLKGERVFLAGKDVSSQIRTPRIDKHISIPVSYAGVRAAMVALQRRLVAGRDAVVEGRDITTVVFPEAEYKFYLDAALQERARRRHKELIMLGVEVTLSEVSEQMRVRDHADFSRKISPLRKAPDARIVDTTGLSIDEVISFLIKSIRP